MRDDRYDFDINGPDPDWLKELMGDSGGESKPPRHAAPDPEPAPKHAAPDPEPDPVQETVYRPARPATQAEREAAIAARARRGYGGQQPVMRQSADRQQAASRHVSAEQMYENTRHGRRGGSNALLITLIVVLVLGMAFAAWQLGSIFRNYRRDRSAYEELANRAIVDLAEQDEEREETEQAPAEPTVTGGGESFASELPIQVDWTYLRSINSSIVGWLFCPDTVVNYPVVQTEDQEYYLKHGFDGNPNTAGTLFADPGSVAGVIQSNFIIYGHNMKDESMFGTFKNYVNRSYYDAHPTMYYLTPNGNYRVDLICARVTESFVENLPGYFSTLADYQAYINEIAGDAFWVNYDAVTTDLQLISLSTCTTAAGIEDARFIVYGVLVPIR